MKTKIISTKFILVYFLFGILFSCQTDDFAPEQTTNKQSTELKFAVDPYGKVLENIPPEILNLMEKEFEVSGKKNEIEILKNTYSFDTGNLTEYAIGSDAYHEKKNELATNKLSAKTNDVPFGYRAHVSGKGWLPWTAYGEVIGTTGESRQLEAIEFTGVPAPICKVGIAHIEGLGWYDQGCGRVLGTIGLGRRMEAVKLDVAQYYRAYVAGFGWLPWVNRGEVAGTTDQRRRMEAFQLMNFSY